MSRHIPRRISHAKVKSKKFNYEIGEQGVLLVEPYKSEILPHWRFKNEILALESVEKIKKIFYSYRRSKDFVGMDTEKAKSAEVFWKAWKQVEEDSIYADWKVHWRHAFG